MATGLKFCGARPSPRHKMAGAMPHRIIGDTPAFFVNFPSMLSMWGNDKFGDCVSAEEAFAKAANSPAIFIPDHTLISWARDHGFLDGANLTEVMDAMIYRGISVEGEIYEDGPYTSLDWTDDAILSNAIFQGTVKIGVASDQLQSVVKDASGWLLTDAKKNRAVDHCVSLCGFGTLAQLATALGVRLPVGTNPSARGYLLFTWGTVGIIDQPSLIAICGEAWLRNPTTVIPGPTPTPNPTPAPTPAPTPTPRPHPCPRLAETLRPVPEAAEAVAAMAEAWTVIARRIDSLLDFLKLP